MMRNVGIHFWALVCSFLLALPPGWCCLLPRHAPPPTTEAPLEPQNDCCCCHQPTQSAPQPTKPAAPLQCSCCPERESRLSDSVSTFQPDLPFLALLLPPDVGLPGALSSHKLASAWHAPP